MAKLGSWSTTAADNNASPPDGWPEGQAPSTVNNCAREMMAAIRTVFQDSQFFDPNITPTRVSDTTFTVSDTAEAAALHIGRRLKLFDASTLYGTITNVTASANTLVTLSLDSGVLTTSLSSYAMGILTVTNRSFPEGLSVGSMTIGTLSISALAVPNINLTGKLSASAIGASSTLSIGGAAHVTGALSVGGAGSIASTLSVGSTAIVTGQITGKAGVSVSGAVGLTGALSVGGAAFVGSTLSVSGAAHVAGLSVGGAAVIGSTLSVGGAAHVAGTFSAGGATTITGNLDVNNTANVSGAFSVGSTAIVTGQITGKAGLSVSGAVGLTGAISVGGAALVGTTLSVGGATHLASTLSVGSTTTITGALDLNNRADVSGVLSVGSAAVISGSLDVNNVVAISSTLSVGGITTQTGALNCKDDLSVSGAGVVTGGISSVRYRNTNVGAGSATTLTEGQLYTITHTTGAVTVTLPASPAVGAHVAIHNATTRADHVIGRNSQNIMSLAENMTIDAANITVVLRYRDATRGWVLE